MSVLKSETLFARLRLIYVVRLNHTALENQNTHYQLWLPYSKLCDLSIAVVLLFLYLYFRNCVRTGKPRVDEEETGYEGVPQQSKSRRKTCHDSALKMRQKAKERLNMEKAQLPKKELKRTGRQPWKYPFQDTYF